MKEKRISKRGGSDKPNIVVPIRKEAHKLARIACAHSGQRLTDFVSDAVTACAQARPLVIP